MPTILCEGISDPIYLKAAMHSRFASFPELVEKGGDKYKLKVKFFKFSNSSAKLQRLSGGSNEIKDLIYEYDTRIAGFRATTNQPLIVVVDSDSGSKEIFNRIESKTGKKVGGPDTFYHLQDNLYVVPVPRQAGKVETAIEDLFDPALLNETVGGRNFNPKNRDNDTATEYGKGTFAREVVAKKKAEIDFSNFDPLLAAIRDAMADFHAKVMPAATA